MRFADRNLWADTPLPGYSGDAVCRKLTKKNTAHGQPCEQVKNAAWEVLYVHPHLGDL